MQKSLLAKQTKEFYIPSLDGIRAIAILLVFLSHIGLGHIIPGGLGVTIFFFLSGFLITTLLRKEYEKTNTINFTHFYIRRIFRIWPNFYFVLFSGAILTIYGIIPGEIKIMPFLSQAFHYANYYLITHDNSGKTIGSEIFWSLAVEEHYYLIFPFLYLLLLRLGLSQQKQFLTLLLFCISILAWRYYLVYEMNASSVRTYYASDTRFDSLFFGCSLAVYRNPVLDDIKNSDKTLKYIYIPLAVLIIVISLLFRSEHFRETIRYSLQGVALYPLFWAAIRFHNWGVFRILNFRAMKFMGWLSYSFYLVHFSVIKVVFLHTENLPIYISASLAFIISITIAYLIYIVIEAPFTRLRKKLI